MTTLTKLFTTGILLLMVGSSRAAIYYNFWTTNSALPGAIYLQAGFDNFVDTTGSIIISYSVDGINFYKINGGNSVWTGQSPGGGVPDGFVPDLMVWTNNLAYLAYCSRTPGGTNIYIGVSTNLLSWSFLTTIPVSGLPRNPNGSVVSNQFFTSKWFVDRDGTAWITGTYTTNGGANYDPYAVQSLNGSMTSWGPFQAPTTPSGGNLRPATHDIDDWQPLFTGSNYVACVSSIGTYMMVFTNAGNNLLLNWNLVGQVQTLAGGLLLGEGNNSAQLPDGTWSMYYDDGPGDANNGYTKYIKSANMVPPNVGSPAGGAVFDDSIPYCPGIIIPIRHGQVWLTTNLPSAMVPALLTAQIPQGIDWNRNRTNSPNYYILRTSGGLVMTNDFGPLTIAASGSAVIGSSVSNTTIRQTFGPDATTSFRVQGNNSVVGGGMLFNETQDLSELGLEGNSTAYGRVRYEHRGNGINVVINNLTGEMEFLDSTGTRYFGAGTNGAFGPMKYYFGTGGSTNHYLWDSNNSGALYWVNLTLGHTNLVSAP